MILDGTKQKLQSRFSGEVIWNIGSFGLIGVIGILLNVIILNQYDGAALGVFNQVYAIYILLSQLAVGGVHLSIQVLIPRFEKDKAERDTITTSALVIAIILSILVCLISYLFKSIPGEILKSDGVVRGFEVVIPGLIFFSMNKILLAYLNGRRFMKSFAVFQLLRFIFILIFIFLFIVFNVPSDYLAGCLTLAEASLFLVLFIYCLRSLSINFSNNFSERLRENFWYGNKALLGNFLMDVNTRVDIFILGMFMSDRMVGLYSIASTAAEGFAQLPMLLRNNINPILVRASHHKGIALLKRIFHSNVKAFYRFLIPLGILCILGFPVFLWIAQLNESFENILSIFYVFALMTGGMVLASGYLPFQMIFNQLGYPSTHTLFIAMIFFSNVILCFLLIPWAGIVGAAMATGASYVLQVFFMKGLLKKTTGITF